MTRLYKLDLEPSEIYNVSLNIKQGNKTVDNLRFFQTKIPKLFNIKPSTFSTFSQITESSDAILTTVINDGISGGADQTLSVKGINWIRSIEKYERSEGETVIDPSGVKYTFTLLFNSDPKLSGYIVNGFTAPFDFLNYRSSYRAGAGNTLQVDLTLLEIDPTVNRTVTESEVTKNSTYLNTIIKGATTVLEFSSKLPGIIEGKTTGKVIYSNGPPKPIYVFDTATVQRYDNYTKDNGAKRYTVTLAYPAILGKAANGTFYYTTKSTTSSFSGSKWGTLGQSSPGYDPDPKKTKFKTSGFGPGLLTFQTVPTYDAKDAKTNYTFKKSSFINSSIVNPNVLEKLIWEDEVRDYIYFIISDIDQKGGDGKKYFFGTHGAISKVATELTPLEGTIPFNAKSPPTAHPYITTMNNKIFKTSTGKVKYYVGSATKTNDQSVPALLRTVTIQFAVARYTKKDEVWTGVWLPASGLPEAEILSYPEELD
jgi:hypothetical protein